MKNFKTNQLIRLALSAILVLPLLGAAQTADTNGGESTTAAAVATNVTLLEAETNKPSSENTNNPSEEARPSRSKFHVSFSDSKDHVSFGHDVEIRPGETVSELTVFGGSARVRGKVQGDAVVFGGKLDVDGEIGGDAVVFGGNIHLQTNAAVRGDAVVFLGGTRLETNATVGGDAVTFGGGVELADGASVHGDVVPFALPGAGGGLPRWVEQWFKQCVLKLRPLAPSVGWLWPIAGAFFLLYLLVAAAFAKPVGVCVEALNRSPVTTILVGLLTKLLIPFVCLLLAITGVGVLVLPFLGIALMLVSVIGKVALLEYFGMSLVRQISSGSIQKPLASLAIGWLLVTILYIIPVIGLITWGILGFWGLGCVVTATFGAMRRERPPKTPIQPAPFVPVPGSGAEPGSSAASPAFAPGSPQASPAAAGEQAQASAASSFTPPKFSMPVGGGANVPENLAYPRAGFWERLAAGFLDLILVSILAGLASVPPMPILHHFRGPPFGLLVALAYFAGMWAWKGTTVGGIVLNLKVVRFDGQHLTFAVAVVRALAGAFSVIVFFLGFLWIAWDRENQGWHDKIAGTLVVRLPRGNPLICI
jgi:uncharacterized RDD family membrane protein YckC